MSESVALYWNTARHLTPEQMAGRLSSLVRKTLDRRTGFPSWLYRRQLRSAASNLRERSDWASQQTHELLTRGDLLRCVDEPPSYHFTFLGRSRSYQRGKIDWGACGETLLWRYNLHYFEYAYDLAIAFRYHGDDRAYRAFRSLVTDWIACNAIGKTVGWDPYPTSLRIVNWLKACHLMRVALACDHEFRQVLVRSLHEQALHLRRNLEVHLLNNHVIENARALIWAGLFLEGSLPERWLSQGRALLIKELGRQVLPDGAQFERSPMYHCAVLLDCAELAALLRDTEQSLPPQVLDVLSSMVSCAEAMLFPDGETAYLNDCAQGMTVPSLRLIAAAKALLGVAAREPAECSELAGPVPVALPAAGYYWIRDRTRNAHLVVDCGELGPSFQPGHGHCDLLSYEWSVDGERVVIDSGADDYYGPVEWRKYYRSTCAHNTISVNGQEQSEIWGRFRVGRRARPLGVTWQVSAEGGTITAGYSGFPTVPGWVRHWRAIGVIGGGCLVVLDVVTGAGEFGVDSFVHLAPGYLLQSTTASTVEVASCGWQACFRPIIPPLSVEVSHGSYDPIQGWCAHRLGAAMPHTVIRARWGGAGTVVAGYCLTVSQGLVSRPTVRASEAGHVIEVTAGGCTYRVHCTVEAGRPKIEMATIG
ncbi:MAG: alginate lyase family protein [Anaerolineae bacterium]|nr:alginate lyase family protein [Anaerolineae bacterium]